MSNNEESTEPMVERRGEPHRVSFFGLLSNLWEIIAATVISVGLRPLGPNISLGVITAGAFVWALTADLGTMAHVGRRLIDVRHVRGVGLTLVLSGVLAIAWRTGSRPLTVKLAIVTLVCSILTGREALAGETFGANARERRQVGRIVRHHNALMAEAYSLPIDAETEVMEAVFPVTWQAVIDAPDGLRNRLIEGDIQ